MVSNDDPSCKSAAGRPAAAADAGAGGARPPRVHPGVVDGKMGMSTVNAIKGFQEARGLQVTGELDQATMQALAQWKHIPATRVVTIPRGVRQRSVRQHSQGSQGPGQARRRWAILAGREDRRALSHDRGGTGRAEPAIAGGATRLRLAPKAGRNGDAQAGRWPSGGDAASRPQYRRRPVRSVGGQGPRNGPTRFACSASEPSSPRPRRSRSTSPTRCSAFSTDRASCSPSSRRPWGSSQFPLPLGHVEDPERRLQSAVAI